MNTYKLCLANYGKSRKLVITHLSNIQNVNNSTTSKELNSINFCDDIMWLYIRIADCTLDATKQTSLFFYVLTDENYKIIFKLYGNTWKKYTGKV